MQAPRSVRVVVLVDDYSGFQAGLLGEHGLSILVEAVYEDGSTQRVLFDTSATGRVLLHNARKLGADLKSISAVVLSHRHWDHTGGLPSLAKALEKTGAVVVAHPDILNPAYRVGNGSVKYIGLGSESRRLIESTGALLTKNHLEVAPGIYYLGEVERYYDNSYAVKGFKTVKNGELVDEPSLDDTGLAVKVGEKVLVIAGCSHSGISNIARKARKLTGASRLLVMGGFHLVSADSNTISRVVRELLDEGVEQVYPGHCTGLAGEAALLQAYRDKLHKIHSGFVLELRAE
ncbi:MAG: MBL fold metallo-hydrolase [Desulfurococcaceae archaeon]